MSEDNKLCPKCDKEANPLDAGDYRRNETEWVRFDNEEHRGYICSNCDWIFGAPVGAYNADPKFGLKSLDEALE
jgi:rubredoxin